MSLQVCCWDTETGICKYTVTGHAFAVTSLALSKSCIYTGTSDALVRKFAMQCVAQSAEVVTTLGNAEVVTPS